MADATNVKNLIVNAGGSSYQINVSDIYTEMGVSEERFAELLSRDFYCPVLPTAPTEQTLTYVDTDGSVNHFAVGQECRVPDIEKKEYQIYKFLGTYQGSAVWIRLEEYDPMHLTYEEQWDHTKVPYKSGMMLKFNQEFFVSLKETSLPPVDLVYMDEGAIAKVDDHTYATVGSYDAVGNKEDWKKIPFDELRLVSRKGILDGEKADVRELSGDDVYRFEPDLYIDLVKGVLKGKKVDLKLPKKNVTDALGYVPISLVEHQSLTSRMLVVESDLDYVLSTIEGNLESLYYGIEFDTSVSLPDCTRIGDMNMHRTLPVHSKMRGCLLDDDGNVVKYLNPNDWREEVRDGSKGQVMVEIPAHYRKFETEGTKRRVKLS